MLADFERLLCLTIHIHVNREYFSAGLLLHTIALKSHSNTRIPNFRDLSEYRVTKRLGNGCHHVPSDG